MKLFLLSIFYGIGLFSTVSYERSTRHAIYVSVLEVKQGSIMVKVFADDLEDAIFNQAQQRPDLLSGNCNQNKILISNYFEKHLMIKIDGKEQGYRYLACEVNDISIWLTFDFTSLSSWGEVEITADYLMELFPTQSNVVSITYQTEKKMFRLTKGDTIKTVHF